ncbi:MAG TPA: VOC family protein [Ktedonobacterales bacterium]
MKLNTVRLLVDDFPTTLRFWRDVMGLPVLYGDDASGEAAVPGYAYLNAGDVGLELFSRDGFAAALGDATPTPMPSGRETVLVLKVEDVDATYAELAARGATSVAGPRDRPEWGARTAHLSDPDGHIIEIYAQLG